jgi:tRNA dimethylallyltransferase
VTPAVLAIGGPTATGKTRLAVAVARAIGGDLVNADSRQVSRRLRVGTAAPTAADLEGVPCHLLDLCEPGERFTVADWLVHARGCLAGLAARDVPAVLVGGTGQYLRALREGWVFGGGDREPAGRAELTVAAASEEGLARLVDELRSRDPEGAAAIDLANPRRVVRALELVRGGEPLGRARRREHGVAVSLVVLDAERALHRVSLEARMAAMFDSGALAAETGAELARGTPPEALRRAGIGYAEALDLLGGRVDLATARATTLQRTRRYVKAQRTWFRHEPAVLRLERGHADELAGLAETVLAAVSERSGPRP